MKTLLGANDMRSDEHRTHLSVKQRGIRSNNSPRDTYDVRSNRTYQSGSPTPMQPGAESSPTAGREGTTSPSQRSAATGGIRLPPPSGPS